MKALSDHFFRCEYGRLVAVLSRRVGLHHLETVENAVQQALEVALESWPRAGLPENPAAWLFRVAQRQLTRELRQRARHTELAAQHALEMGSVVAEPPEAWLVRDVRDDLLRMLFTCSDPALPVESQLVLALKVLCGFDVREIAERLLTTEASVYKRLVRAREQLRASMCTLDELQPAELAARLPAVQSILYVLFTEGYLSSHAEGAVRRELCDEAIRLGEELAQHPVGSAPETFALLALMHLHGARLPARQDGSGGFLLLQEQDRALWDQAQIATGLTWLARAADGDAFSRYHAEAGIAAEHCLAPTFEETRWERIVECYALLEQLQPSSLHTLNRALAVAEWLGPAQGLAVLDGCAPPPRLEGSHFWSAVRADLHARCGELEIAQRHAADALERAPSEAIREALQRRLGTYRLR